jgi:glutamine synthetase
MATPKDVLKLIADNEVRFVDFRFTDTRGKEQHVSVPVVGIRRRQVRKRPCVRRFVDRRLEGHRSIGHAADPGSKHRFIDPFYEESTLVLTCDVVEPADGKGYERDPRSLAKRAEAYLKSSGSRRHGILRSGTGILHFRLGISGARTMSGCFVKIGSEEAPWSSAKEFEGGNTGHRPGTKGGYFPVAAGRHVPGHPLGNVSAARTDRHSGRSASPRSGGPGPE